MVRRAWTVGKAGAAQSILMAGDINSLSDTERALIAGPPCYNMLRPTLELWRELRESNGAYGVMTAIEIENRDWHLDILLEQARDEI